MASPGRSGHRARSGCSPCVGSDAIAVATAGAWWDPPRATAGRWPGRRRPAARSARPVRPPTRLVRRSIPSSMARRLARRPAPDHRDRTGRGTGPSTSRPSRSPRRPFGRIVLVGADDGQRSRLRVVDVVAGCTWHVGRGGRGHPPGDRQPRRRDAARDARRPDRPGRTSASGGAARRRRPATLASCRRSSPTRASGGPGRPSSTGRSTAIASRSSPAVRSPAGRASSTRPSGACETSSPTRSSARWSG